MLVVSAIALVACFTSCDKTCVCKCYENNVLIYEHKVELAEEGVRKCSDMNDVFYLGKKYEVECK